MASVQLILLLLAAASALQVLARRISVPHPALLVLGGIGLALVPGLPRVKINPEILFLVFVPPLLYRAAVTTSLRDFRDVSGPIVRLGVVLVLLSVGAVAWVAHTLTAEFTWPAAFALGAIVAPPDPVAAVAVMRSIGVPNEITSILEGEGLVNDAAALVAYRLAVGAAVTGLFSPTRAAEWFVLAAAGGIAIGFTVGWLIGLVRRSIRGLPVVENTVSLLTPFAAYLPADKLHASGVLAVVTIGLYMGWMSPRLIGAATRVQSEAMWSMVTFILESLTFILVGLELPYVMRAIVSHSLGERILYGAAVSAALIVVRMVWVFPSAYVPRLFTRRGARRRRPPWRFVAFVGWAGVRGGDSLVIALALPYTTAAGAPFPARDLIVFVTFAVIFATLVLQGMWLRPILRLLGLHDDGRTEAEEARARRAGAEAGLARLEELASAPNVNGDSVTYLRRMHKERARRWAAGGGSPAGVDGKDRSERRASSYRDLRSKMITAERDAIVRLRDEGTIGDDAMRRVQRELDFETMLLENSDEDAPDSPYEAS